MASKALVRVIPLCGLLLSGCPALPPAGNGASASTIVEHDLKPHSMPIGATRPYGVSPRDCGSPRPALHLSGDAFIDKRLATGRGRVDVADGGAVEVFCNPSEAAARAAALRRSPGPRAESDRVHGDIVLRLSTRLTAAQVGAYVRALTAG